MYPRIIVYLQYQEFQQYDCQKPIQNILIHDSYMPAIESLVLQIDCLPGEKSEDYAKQFLDSLRDIVESYSSCFDKNCDTICREVDDKIKNTITDRGN